MAYKKNVFAAYRYTAGALIVNTAAPGTWQQAANTKVLPIATALTAPVVQALYNSQSQISIDVTNVGVLLAAGKWRVRGSIILTNTTAATNAIVRAALTDEVSSALTALYYETEPKTLLGTALGEVVNQTEFGINTLLDLSTAKVICLRASLGTAATTGNIKGKSELVFERVGGTA